MFDALDEAKLELRSALIAMLNSLKQEIFRVIITSREDLTISTKDSITQSDNIKANSTDMDRLLIARLCELRSDLKSRKKLGLVQELVFNIRENAQEM